jgi:hypothetical protein
VALPLVLGHCGIGHWEPAKGIGNAIRGLQGRMDELLILKRALRDTELKTMFEQGKPASTL